MPLCSILVFIVLKSYLNLIDNNERISAYLSLSVEGCLGHSRKEEEGIDDETDGPSEVVCLAN